MNKIGLLFNKNTLINFSYFGLLIKRYKFSVLFVIAIFISSLAYIYINQSKIYLRTISFIGIESSNQSQNNMMNFLGTGNSEKLSLPTLRGILDSWGFQAALAEKVYQDSHFNAFMFSINNKKVTGKQVMHNCIEVSECITNEVIKGIEKNIKIVKNSNTPGFTLRVHGPDEFTVKKIEKYVTSELLNFRKNQIGFEAKKRLEMLDQIIKKKSDKFGDIEFDNLKENLKIGEGHLNDLDKSIKEVQFMRNKEKAKLFEIDLKLQFYAKGKGKADSQGDSLKLEKRTKLEKELLKLQKNSEILSLNNQKGENEFVLKELKREIASIEKKLKQFQLKSDIQTFKKLQKNKNEIIPELTIERKVLKANVKKLDAELKDLDKRRSSIVKNINQLKKEINKINPDNELITQLRAEYNNTLMKVSTISPDLEFEDFSPHTKVLEEHSVKKMIFLVFFGVIFISFSISLFRFLFDEKLYSQTEILSEFEDLKILGESAKITLNRSL